MLVTGASSGIGEATAQECALLGANVVVTGRNEARLQAVYDALDRSEDQQHHMVVADLLNDDDITRLIENCNNVDGVMLSVGKGLTLPVQFATREKFDDIFNINFLFTFINITVI